MEVPYDSQNAAIIPIMIHMPKPFPYDSSTIVPRKYGVRIVARKEEIKPCYVPTVVNIAYVSCITRSGCLFAQVPPQKEKPRNNNLFGHVPPQKDMPRKDLGKEPVALEPLFGTKDDD